jgi:diguanylate cyclase (GGDEF)-like protein
MRGLLTGSAWSVRTRLYGIVGVVALLILGAGAWLAVATLREAESQARRDASFQAGLAADAVTDALAQGESAMAGLARGFPVEALKADPTKCQLTFADLGVFPVGHIDIVMPDGQVPCSSIVERGAPPGASHAGAGWLNDARIETEPRVAGIFTDRLTGQRAVAVTAPIIGQATAPDGYVTLVLSLDSLADGLAAVYGGPQHYSFTVHGPAAKLLAGDPETQPERSITGRRGVDQTGWTVTAQQPRSAALAATRTAFTRLAALAGAAFALLLVLLVAVNRSIGRPLRRLTAAAAQGSQHVNPEWVPEGGPTEIRRLAHEFNEMTAARASYEDELTHRALHDPLTGLPSRALCQDRLAQALQAARTPSRVAVLSVDVDRFKLVNASFGYGVGDEVLIAAATRLAGVLDPADTLARPGGDGFVICRPDAGDTRSVEGLATQVMSALAEPFTIAGTEVTLTASVGIARGRHAVATDALLRDAHTAMYAAKEAGGGRFRVIDDDLRVRSSERLTVEADLRVALNEDQLQVHYQPVVNLVTGKITGAEALLRWMHPTRGQVPPLTFIPVAEDAGLISPIGRFVLEQACRQAATWNNAGHHLRVAVNVSGLQLRDPGFVGTVADILHNSGLKPAQLCLELTETTLMDDAMRASDVLADLKDIGVDLSVDDFGTGYSSLAYLKRFPVDELKIDRSFVSNLGTGRQDQTLVAAMVAMGHALGLHVVAEGVETHTQMATLRTLGCRTAQGYLFAKPMALEQFTALLRTGLPAELRRAASAAH